MQNRRSRVELEPDLVEPHVVVSINHPTLGIKTRFFKPSSLFVAVYDWIGSIAEKPKFFDLKNDGGILMQPDLSLITSHHHLLPTITMRLAKSERKRQKSLRMKWWLMSGVITFMRICLKPIVSEMY